ncbi:MAG: ABC-F family ATP-binding cassette domain-containing protein [Thermaerobacter sp.]|nr:ABC-F family ATP-binding cassette domain-containing protein [Thermaerobacter sp.]
MLDVRDLSVSFGGEKLFSDVSFQIASGERVALLGENGCGKSTLLRVLAGEVQPDPGSTVRLGDLSRITYVEQAPADVDDALSAGQRMRRRIAAAIAERPSLLLLDEPTNHLDPGGLVWLQAQLRNAFGAIVFACHDRAFVEAVAGRILHLSRGSLRSFSGGYRQYEERIAAEAASQGHRHDAWRKERDRVRAASQRQRTWAEQAHRDAGERNPSAKRRAAQLMHKAMATERRVARLDEERVLKPWEAAPLSFSFLPPRDLPPVLARAQDVAFTYAGAKRAAFGPLSFDLRRGERLALEGANGTGKTTLLRLLMSAAGLEHRPEGRMQGRLSVHPGARLLFFRQEEQLHGQGTPLQEMLAAGAPDPSLARTLLGHFHLRGDSALRPVASLSPGERVRLGFCLSLVRGADILLLDEPTNHLDIDGREALEEALTVYPGTVVFVSHDERFRTRVATRALALRLRGMQEPRPVLERDLLQMRLAELSGRLSAAPAKQRAGLEAELDRIVAQLKAMQ